MVAQRELDEQLRAIKIQEKVEERDWRDEERKLFEFEETYLRETAVHGNLFSGWGDAKTASIRFRNAALRRKKRERQEPATLATTALSTEEQLKLDKYRVASYSSLASPSEPIRATLEERETERSKKGAHMAAVATKAAETSSWVSEEIGRASPAKKKARMSMDARRK